MRVAYAFTILLMATPVFADPFHDMVSQHQNCLLEGVKSGEDAIRILSDCQSVLEKLFDMMPTEERMKLKAQISSSSEVFLRKSIKTR